MTQNIDLKCFPYSYEELERLAAENTSPEAFDYVQSGSSTEQTLRTNVQAFSSYAFKPRVCTGTKAVDSKIEIFGKEYPFPIFFAPVGNQKVVHPEGELASARAAKRLNVPYIASTVSSHTIEEIAEASGNGDRWFQLYATKDQDVTNSLISRAEKNGYTAIVLTVDMAPSWRVKDMRNQFLPFSRGQKPYPSIVSDPVFQEKYGESVLENGLEKTVRSIFPNPEFSWDQLKELKKITSLPIIVKGILDEDDAHLALEFGADGIVVSNHGGRMIDGCIPAIEALPNIAEVVKKRVPVFLDSGIRSAKDVVIALALGADAVFLGRPFIYGLAIAGEEGVHKVFSNQFEEFRRMMILCGTNNIDNIKNLKIIKIS
ncbi:Lactate 2-monooxygenase [Ureibacillus acetophenoni]